MTEDKFLQLFLSGVADVDMLATFSRLSHAKLGAKRYTDGFAICLQIVSTLYRLKG